MLMKNALFTSTFLVILDSSSYFVLPSTKQLFVCESYVHKINILHKPKLSLSVTNLIRAPLGLLGSVHHSTCQGQAAVSPGVAVCVHTCWPLHSLLLTEMFQG